MDRAATLEQLTRLCNLNREGVAPVAVEPTGFSELDAILPNGGWQSGTIVELMPAAVGIGELRLLMPALSRITQGDRHVALVSPPYIPFAPAFHNQGVRLDRLLIIRAVKQADLLWTMEQTLRCKAFGAVVGWPDSLRDRDIRRLQLAAEAGRTTGFVYRPVVASAEASPAALRLRLEASERELQIDILKCRGARAGQSVILNRGAAQTTSASSSLAHSDYPLSLIR